MRTAKGRGSRKRPLTPEQRAGREAAIIADIKAGVLSYREIALKHGVSLPTVNNKARKAGISRGRRKGARILVRRPARKVRRKVAKKAARAVAPKKVAAPAARGRKKARKVAARPRRKAARRARRPAAAKRRRRPVGTATRAKSGFSLAFRKLVLKHNPGISLQKFDKLAKLVESATR